MSTIVAKPGQVRPLTSVKPMSGMIQATTAGRSSPLGATVVPGGVNFSLFSRRATGVELVFFDREDESRHPARSARSGHEPHLSLLARICAGRLAGADLRLPRRRPGRT